MMHLRLTYTLMALTIVLSTGYSAQAQQREKKSAQADSLYRQVVTQLDEQSQQLADEYLEVLEQLQEVIDDYRMYLEDLDAGKRKEQEVPITVLSEGLKTRKYASIPEELLSDIEGVISDIKRIEADQKAKYNTNNPSSTRVIRNLRKELVTIADMAEDYSDTQVKGVFNRKETQAYMQQSLKEMAKRFAGAGWRTGRDKDPGDNEADPVEPPRIIYIPPVAPSVPQSPQIPSKPALPPAPPLPSGWTTGESSETGDVCTFQNSVEVSAHDRIIISNPTGGLQITGDGEDDMVAVQLEVEVAAKSREKEKKFIAGTSLQVKRVAGGYEIVAIYPRIADAETRVLRSILAVSIPGPNPVECSNAFGDVQISDLTGGVTLTSTYSRVSIVNIQGAVSASGSMGAISIEDVAGPVTAANTYAAIEITACQGQIAVTGSYAPTELSDNSGPVRITNTASVSVQNHTGTVTINNSYGSVDISEVEGDISVTNTYQAISVSDIAGAAQVRNSYSSIDISGVSEKLLVSNQYGNTTMANVVGPLDITCDGGSLELAIDDEFSGNSSITATRGTVDVSIEGEPDVTVTAQTSGGMISSDLKTDLRSGAADRTAAWKFGTGRYALKILATDANLTISQSP